MDISNTNEDIVGADKSLLLPEEQDREDVQVQPQVILVKFEVYIELCRRNLSNDLRSKLSSHFERLCLALLQVG